MGFNVLWILPTGSFDHPTFSVNLLNFVQYVKSKHPFFKSNNNNFMSCLKACDFHQKMVITECIKIYFGFLKGLFRFETL